MARSRFVQPDTVRLSLSDGDYIDIKKRLNIGELESVLSRIPSSATSDYAYATRYALSNVLEHLVGWSFLDGEKPVAYSVDMPIAEREAVMKNLSPEDFKEIREAIEAHTKAMDDARSAEKNATTADGAADSKPTLSSVA